jgi:hypothetical protein
MDSGRVPSTHKTFFLVDIRFLGQIGLRPATSHYNDTLAVPRVIFDSECMRFRNQFES